MVQRIGCIGCGNMGGAILGGLANTPGLELSGYNRSPERLIPLVEKGIREVASIPLLVQGSDMIVIGVKPGGVRDVLLEARQHLTPDKTVISLASGVTVEALREAVGERCPVVRVMPNTPALVGAGVFALCLEDPTLREETRDSVLDLFAVLGSTVVLPEAKFKAFTALVGCGPAYVFHFMDALTEAGVTLGFSRKESLELVTQLVLGSAKLAAVPGSHPALLREEVCSPAGVTIAAINHMDRTALRGHLIDAILIAHERS